MKRIAIGIYVTEGAGRLEQTLSAVRANTAESVNVSLLVDAHANVAETVIASHGIPRCISPRVVGAPACFNRLIGGAADVFIFLESGSLVSPGWLEALLAALDADPRNGLAGPSTNLSWNEQAAFPHGGGTPSEIARTAAEAAERFGRETRVTHPAA